MAFWMMRALYVASPVGTVIVTVLPLVFLIL